MSRTVYFMNVIVRDEDENEVPAQPGTLLPAIWEHTDQLAASDSARLRVAHRGTQCVGRALTGVTVAQRYFYIARHRRASDHPDVEDAQGFSTFDLTAYPGAPLGLVEPAYLMPVNGTDIVAVRRTAGGPSWSALENWFNSIAPQTQPNHRIHLEPFSRGRLEERVDAALGATQIQVKVDPYTDLSPQNGGIEAALHNVQQEVSQFASVELAISLGTDRERGRGWKGSLDEVFGLRRKPGVSKVKGRLMEQDPETGKLRAESVDFLKDRVTMQLPLTLAADQPIGREEMVSALSETVQRFRKVEL